MTYKNRNIAAKILARTRHDQVIALTGARQTGKTTLCEDILPERAGVPYTYISFDDPDERLRFQNNAIAILEAMDTPVVILDEVQKIPALFDPLKYVVDRQKKLPTDQKKVFLLTGSSQLRLLKGIRETLAGRVSLFNLFPFSLSEVLENDLTPLLTKIWENGTLDKKDVRLSDILPPKTIRMATSVSDEHKIWGGYPPVWLRKEIPDKINWLKDYRKTYLERDISDVGQVANIDTFALAQKLLCARTAQLFSISEVARDLSVAVNTVKRYIDLLTLSFQCYLVQPFYENIGKRLIKSPKIYFPDVGLNQAILGETVVESGASYETWVFSELLKWAQLQSIEPEIYFYRTPAGMEIDFLISAKGKILPVEVKSSPKVGYADARSIESFMTHHNSLVPLGIVVYSGREIVEIRKNIWGIPDWLLFGGL